MPTHKTCTTTQGPGLCCTAAQQGLLNRPFRFQIRSGPFAGQERCGECTQRASTSRKHPGQPVFMFRFRPGQQCGIVRGCPVVGPGAGAPGGGQPTLLLPPG